MKTFRILVFVTLVFAGCSTGKSNLQITDFTGALNNSGIAIDNQEQMMYQLLMASDGYSINIDGDVIEAYQFDTKAESGEEALKKWESEGIMGRSVLVNKNLLIIKNTDHPKWEKIKTTFLSL